MLLRLAQRVRRRLIARSFKCLLRPRELPHKGFDSGDEVSPSEDERAQKRAQDEHHASESAESAEEFGGHELT